MGTIKSRNQRSRNPSNSVGPNRSGLIGSSQDPHNQKSSNDKTLNQDFSCSISETNEEDSDDDEEESKEDGGEGKKSIAITVKLQPIEATLTDKDIEAVTSKIIDKVAKATGGVLRC
jgi:hypothetical protein